MNRTDRLLAIVLRLQAKGWQRAEDLAEYFEISKRTIYRDMLALMESGVPVISQPGQGYSLDPGYFLPPLHFTADEAITLILGTSSVAQHFDEQYRRAAESSAHKIEAVLGERLKAQVADLKASLRFVSLQTMDEPDLVALLQQIRRAILDRKTIRFTYQKRLAENEDGRIRDIDPHGLLHIGTTWYVAGYCHLRRDMRTFRLERIDHLTVLASTFTRQPDYDLQSNPPRTINHMIRVVFDLSVARWVLEERNFYVLEQHSQPDGLYLTLGVRTTEDVIRWLIGWGDKVRVLEPESLIEEMVAAAQSILKLYHFP